MQTVEKEARNDGNLMLTRSVGQSINVADLVRIEVVRIMRGRVRLRIQAPKDMRIVRPEAQLRLVGEVDSEVSEFDLKGA